MFGLGPQEAVVILIVALVLFGPKRLPEVGQSLGRGLRELKRASRSVMDSLNTEDEDTHSKEN